MLVSRQGLIYRLELLAYIPQPRMIAYLYPFNPTARDGPHREEKYRRFVSYLKGLRLMEIAVGCCQSTPIGCVGGRTILIMTSSNLISTRLSLSELLKNLFTLKVADLRVPYFFFATTKAWESTWAK